jgi:pimeloyl-ACP methyl ester carboxylesterase
MATAAPRDVAALALVGAMGVKPPQGDILDQALVSYVDYVKAGFHRQAAMDAVYGAEPSTDQLVEWDVCREMSFRIAWKPYMYSQTLPHLLGGVKARALVVHGDDDRVVPLSASEVYARALPGATLQIVEGSGHYVEMEKPTELAALVTALAGNA